MKYKNKNENKKKENEGEKWIRLVPKLFKTPKFPMEWVFLH